MMASSVHFLVLLVYAVLGAEGARILMLSPIGGKSMKNLFYGLGSSLAPRGHEVVFFNNFKPTSAMKGIREVVPDALAKVFTDDKLPNMFKMNENGMQAGWKQYQSFLFDGPQAALASMEFDQLLKENFDIVILGSFPYAFYFVPHVLKAPFILLTALPYCPILTGPFGNPTIPALNPTFFSMATDNMTFLQRVKNVLSHLFIDALLRRVYTIYTDRMVAEKFGKGVMPPALEIERNASLVLLNSNPAMDYHKPLLPNVIEVGGMHCTKPKPLPKELIDFVGNSEFVFFSLGSVAKPQDMSPGQKSAILTALGSLPFKVLLKWVTTDRTNIPANILPSKWLPQQNILGNSKCRLFISHGGFASLVESVCHGVPMVMLPISADQHFNALNAADMGIAEILTWDKLSPESLKSAIDTAMSASHQSAARYRKELLASQPVPPRDLAVHWVEHVIRHGGAPHLRSVGTELNFFQYYSLDVLAFLLAVLVLLLKLLVATVKCCCRCACGRKASQVPDAPERAKRD